MFFFFLNNEEYVGDHSKHLNIAVCVNRMSLKLAQDEQFTNAYKYRVRDVGTGFIVGLFYFKQFKKKYIFYPLAVSTLSLHSKFQHCSFYTSPGIHKKTFAAP